MGSAKLAYITYSMQLPLLVPGHGNLPRPAHGLHHSAVLHQDQYADDQDVQLIEQLRADRFVTDAVSSALSGILQRNFLRFGSQTVQAAHTGTNQVRQGPWQKHRRESAVSQVIGISGLSSPVLSNVSMKDA